MNKILHGDALEVLKTLEDESVDLVCTDPPYGIGFMGKEWDTFKPERVQKMAEQNKKRPPRTDGRNVPIGGPARDAGTYDYRKNKQFQEFITEHGKEWLRVLKPGAFVFMTMSPRQDVLSRAMLALEDAGFNTGFTSMYWTFASGFPKAQNMKKAVMKRVGDVGEIVGKENIDIGMQGGSMHAGRSTNVVERDVVAPTNSRAKALDGSYGGFQPKPAVEVIIVAMKPLSEKTYVDQALKNGKGITWLDDCRVPTEQDLNGGAYTKGRESRAMSPSGASERQTVISGDFLQPAGRFPANLLVSDDVLNDGRVLRARGNKTSKTHLTKREGFTAQMTEHYEPGTPGDTGSYSRFFSLDSWAQTLPFLIVPKASKSEKNAGLDGFEVQKPNYSTTYRPTAEESGDKGADTPYAGTNRNGTMKNGHPTVKPLKLMSYLITLGSRPGDVVLDPFVGSGSTCVAAKELGRDFIGIEREREYCDITEARLAAVQPTLLTNQQ